METIINPEIESYCEAHTSHESKLLYNLYRSTFLHAVKPRMMSGLLQGRFLSLVSQMIRPRRILEIGTFTGYSALCLAEGLTADGFLDTIEVEEEYEEPILKYFNQSPYVSQLRLHIGDAEKVVPTFLDTYDLAFIDAEKRGNETFYELVLPKMRKGGVVLIDNVLWSGKVVENADNPDLDTAAIMAFNDYVQHDTRVSNLLLPFRDGMLIVVKL